MIELYVRLVEQYKVKWNITEELKENDQMKWVQETNNIRVTIEETLINEIINQNIMEKILNVKICALTVIQTLKKCHELCIIFVTSCSSLDSGYMKQIRARILSAVDGTIFVTSDFADIADSATLRQSLNRLV